MNWTGGRLSRHSHVNQSSVKQKQRQHFAKVRNSIGNSKPSPSKWSIFDVVRDDLPFDNSTRLSGMHVSRVKEIQSNELAYGFLQKSPVSIGTRRRTPLQGTSHNVLRVSDESGTSSRGEPFIDQSFEPHNRKRNYDCVGVLVKCEKRASLTELERKRQKLLHQGDWVGVNIQRRLAIKFSSQKEKERIGIRRRISNSRPAVHSTNNSARKASLPPVARNGSNVDKHGPQDKFQTPLNIKGDVRVFIGRKEVRAGFSSGTVRSRLRNPSNGSSPSVSSDVMLLDMDQSRLSSPRYGSLKVQNLEAVNDGDSSRSPFSNTQALFGKLHQEAHSIDHVYDIEPTGTKFLVVGKLYCMSGGLGDTCGLIADGQTDKAIESSGIHRTSSQISIQHPIPRTARTFQLLHSISPEIPEGTIANGSRHYSVPLSQQLDEETWSSWFMPSSVVKEENEDDYGIESTCHGENEIHIPIASKASSFTPADVPSQPSIPPINAATAKSHVNSGEVSDGRPSQRKRFLEVYSPKRTKLFTRWENRCVERPSITESEPNNDGPSPIHVMSNSASSIIRRHEDPDAAWRKFIFGDKEDDVVDNWPRLRSHNLFEIPTADDSDLSLAAQPPSQLDENCHTPSSTLDKNLLSGRSRDPQGLTSDSTSEIYLPQESVIPQPATQSDTTREDHSSPFPPRNRIIFTRPAPYRPSATRLRESSPIFLGGRCKDTQTEGEISTMNDLDDHESIEDD